MSLGLSVIRPGFPSHISASYSYISLRKTKANLNSLTKQKILMNWPCPNHVLFSSNRLKLSGSPPYIVIDFCVPEMVDLVCYTPCSKRKYTLCFPVSTQNVAGAGPQAVLRDSQSDPVAIITPGGLPHPTWCRFWVLTHRNSKCILSFGVECMQAIMFCWLCKKFAQVWFQSQSFFWHSLMPGSEIEYGFTLFTDLVSICM